MDRDELAAIRARVEAASDAYFDHLAPRCSHTFVGEGLNCGLSSGHDGPHSRRPPANDGWRYMNETRQDVLRLCDEVDRLTAEVARLSGMVPRWEFGAPSRGELMVGECRIGSVVRMSPGDWSAWATDSDGASWLYVCREQTAESACAAVCARLGLTDIKPPTEGT